MLSFNEFIDRYTNFIDIQKIEVESFLDRHYIYSDPDKFLVAKVPITIYFEFGNKGLYKEKVLIDIYDLDKVFDEETIDRILGNIQSRNSSKVSKNLIEHARKVLNYKKKKTEHLLLNGVSKPEDVDYLVDSISNRLASKNIAKSKRVTEILSFSINNGIITILNNNELNYKDLKNKIKTLNSYNDITNFLNDNIELFNIDPNFNIKSDHTFILNDIKYYSNKEIGNILNKLCTNYRSFDSVYINDIFDKYFKNSNILQVLSQYSDNDFEKMKKDLELPENFSKMIFYNVLYEIFEHVGNIELENYNCTLYDYLKYFNSESINNTLEILDNSENIDTLSI